MNETDFFRIKRNFQKNEINYDSIFKIPSLNIDNDALTSYLTIGYVPGEKTLFSNVKCISKNKSKNNSLKKILGEKKEYIPSHSEIKKALLSSIEKNYHSKQDHIVPLSGGMDSRIILAALLEFTEAKNINTYTFGVTRAYDYEIPNAISKYLGTNHINFSASETRYTIDGLIRAAIESDGNTEIFHPLVLNRVSDYFGKNTCYWSGFAGDLIGGGFSTTLNTNNPYDALIKYETRGINFKDNLSNLETTYSLLSNSKKMDDYTSEAEGIFWENHLERYTSHHIFRNDMNISSPFIDFNFIKLFYSLPEKKRIDKTYFNEIFSSIFPDLFKFPTKDYGYKYSKLKHLQSIHKIKFYCSSLGWRISPKNITHPNTAYIDMKNSINERTDIRNCIDELINDLKKRNIINNEIIDNMIKLHRTKKSNFSKDIINLASLEVILKAANI